MTTPPKATSRKVPAAGTKAGPKPAFLVVEDSLKCQTSEGELSLRLSVSFGTIRRLMKLNTDDRFEEFEFFLEHVFTEEQVNHIDRLDAAESANILKEFSDRLAERMNASLGESGSSSE